MRSIAGVATMAALAVFSMAQLPYARQALDLGRTHDDALYDAFSRSYLLTPNDTVERAEAITEFRRAVMIVREHAMQGDFGFTAHDLDVAMKPQAGLVGFVVQAKLHPLHVYAAPPPFDLYVATGPATKPIAAAPLKRDPVFPPGASPDTSMIAVRLEGTFKRADIVAAPSPSLVVTDEKANVLWQARIDLTRYR